MRLFSKTRANLERIIREEIDEPRERQALEVVAEAEDAAREGDTLPARGPQRGERPRR